MAFEVLVMHADPDNFVSWPREQKIDRYERVVQWHDYIQRVHESGRAPCVWGSHQLLSRANFVQTLGLLIAVYRVESWSEFDDLLLDDPLRDVSRYVTTPLAPLLEDRVGDLERYEHAKAALTGSDDPLRPYVQARMRALYADQPDYVGQRQDYRQPPNPKTTFDRNEASSDPLEIMVMGVNPEDAIAHWDDTRMVIHYEKVNWWHDYMTNLVERGKVTHVWGAHNFFDITGLSGLTKGAGVAVYTVDSFDEFDDLYRGDPIREMTMFWSVLLRPIADQRRYDEERLARARR